MRRVLFAVLSAVFLVAGAAFLGSPVSDAAAAPTASSSPETPYPNATITNVKFVRGEGIIVFKDADGVEHSAFTHDENMIDVAIANWGKMVLEIVVLAPEGGKKEFAKKIEPVPAPG